MTLLYIRQSLYYRFYSRRSPDLGSMDNRNRGSNGMVMVHRWPDSVMFGLALSALSSRFSSIAIKWISGDLVMLHEM